MKIILTNVNLMNLTFIKVKGFSKAIYKSFPCKKDAEAFIQNHSHQNMESFTKANKQNTSESVQMPSAKRQKVKGDHENINPKNKMKNEKSHEIKMILHFDGGSRGNGQYKDNIAGAGAFLVIHSMFRNETIKIRKFLDKKNHKGAQMSNNFAEYSGLIAGLHEAKKRFFLLRKELKKIETIKTSLNIFGDSFLVVNQMNKQYGCKSFNLIPLYNEAMVLIEEMKKEGFGIRIEHVYRDKNTEADGESLFIFFNQV